MYSRLIRPLEESSFFLFGARGTGKTSLLNHIFPASTLRIDLLNDKVYRRYLTNVMLLEELVTKSNYKWVVIDEVQRIPELLNSVHRLIESTNTKFALTGSSARKLKRGNANLLAGRAFLNYLYPLSFKELKKDFNLEQVLKYGSLPKIFQFQEDNAKETFLESYVDVYLKEEIRLEQLIRKIEPFYNFLKIIASSNGEILNYSKLGASSNISDKTVVKYMEILIDTLVGFFLPAYNTSIRKQTIGSSKFYLFDLGVKRALAEELDMPFKPNTFAFGKAFEHFFILECIKLNHYMHKRYNFSYLKTSTGSEIDLIIEKKGVSKMAIEIKSSTEVDANKLKNNLKLTKELGINTLYVASNEPMIRNKGDIIIMPWEKLLENLFFS